MVLMVEVKSLSIQRTNSGLNATPEYQLEVNAEGRYVLQELRESEVIGSTHRVDIPNDDQEQLQELLNKIGQYSGQVQTSVPVTSSLSNMLLKIVFVDGSEHVIQSSSFRYWTKITREQYFEYSKTEAKVRSIVNGFDDNLLELGWLITQLEIKLGLNKHFKARMNFDFIATKQEGWEALFEAKDRMKRMLKARFQSMDCIKNKAGNFDLSLLFSNGIRLFFTVDEAKISNLAVLSRQVYKKTIQIPGQELPQLAIKPQVTSGLGPIENPIFKHLPWPDAYVHADFSIIEPEVLKEVYESFVGSRVSAIRVMTNEAQGSEAIIFSFAGLHLLIGCWDCKLKYESDENRILSIFRTMKIKYELEA